jgi:hypothetical protein
VADGAVSGGSGAEDPVVDGTAGRGRNFRIRNSIDATASVPTYQVLRVVTNQPSPSDVCFGPVTSCRLARTVTCSPGRR